MPGDFSSCRDHFSNAESGPIPQIVDPTSPVQRFQGENMSPGKIADVDEIPDTGTVWSFVVAPEDREAVTNAQRHLEDERDQVGLRVVVLPPLLGCPSRIEVAERCPAQTMDLL